nr:hypothetical protein CFP56_68669 [Quercus suber]
MCPKESRVVEVRASSTMDVSRRIASSREPTLISNGSSDCELFPRAQAGDRWVPPPRQCRHSLKRFDSTDVTAALDKNLSLIQSYFFHTETDNSRTGCAPVAVQTVHTVVTFTHRIRTWFQDNIIISDSRPVQQEIDTVVCHYSSNDISADGLNPTGVNGHFIAVLDGTSFRSLSRFAMVGVCPPPSDQPLIISGFVSAEAGAVAKSLA